MLAKTFLIIASASGLIAVVLGAFGAHKLKGVIESHLWPAYETASHYHFYHSLLLLALGFSIIHFPASSVLKYAGWFCVAGTLLFCGSLYLLALGGPRWLGPVTPLGGVFLIFAWASMVYAFCKVSI